MDGKLYPETRLRQNHAKKVQGTQLGGIQKGASDPIARLDDMDTDGIDVQVMYGSLGLSISTIADVDFAIAMARACNDYYAELLRAAPNRLDAMATLAVQDVAGGGRRSSTGGHRARPRRRARCRRTIAGMNLDDRVLPSDLRRGRSGSTCRSRSTGATAPTCRRPGPSASTPTSCCTPSGIRSSR